MILLITELKKTEGINIKLKELERHRPYLQKEFYTRRKETLENERRKLTCTKEEVF